MERAAVPARGFAHRALAVRKLARPATTPVYQELVARGADRLSATMTRGTGLSQRPQKPRRVPRRSAERRARPLSGWSVVTRIVRGARRTGQRVRVRSSEAPVRRLSTRRSALRPPCFIWGSFRAVAWHSSDANKKRAARMMMLILPRDSGEGGPSREARWWKGRRTQRVIFVERVSLR
jgi:hypothetical protein